MNNKKKIVLIALIITLILGIIGVAYAYFGLEVEGTGKDIVMDTGDLRLEYMDDTELSLVGATPGDSISKTITVKNVGTRNVAYTLYWGDLINTIENFELHITMECKSYTGYGTDSQEESGTCDRIYRAVPMSDTVTSGTIKSNISIDVGVTHEYNLTVSFDNKTYEQNYNKNKKFTGKIGIEEYKAPEPIYCTYDGTVNSSTTFVKDIYSYYYDEEHEGWGVNVKDVESTDAITDAPCTYINDKPIVFMSYMFFNSKAVSIDTSNFVTTNIIKMSGMFSNYKGNIIDVSYLDISNITDISEMFFKSTATEIIGLENLDTSKVTDMHEMFERSNVDSLNLSGFNTSNVTDMRNMFSNSNISTLDLSSFDTSKVTDMYQMFYGTKMSMIDLSGFDTSNVTNMSWMFYGSVTTEIKGLESFDTSNVTDMNRMFENTKIKTIDLSKFDTSNVTSMSGMFYGSEVEKLDLRNFNTSKVTSMSSMFSNSAVTEIKGLDNFDTSKVTDMDGMFSTTKIVSLDLSSFDTSNVTRMSYMFLNCTNLTTIYASSKFVVDNVINTNTYPIFYNNTNLVGGNGTKYSSSHTDKTYARIDGGPDSDTPGYFTLKSN